MSLETEKNPAQVIQGQVLRTGREPGSTPENVVDSTTPFPPLPDYNPSEYHQFFADPPPSFDLKSELDDELRWWWRKGRKFERIRTNLNYNSSIIIKVMHSLIICELRIM